MSRHLVSDIMRTDIVTLTPATPIRRAVALLVEGEAAAAPVLSEDGGLAGLLTQKDCFRPALHAGYYRDWTGNVADHMTAEVVTVDAGEDVMHAAEMFLDLPHRAFPVLKDKRVVGLLDRADVLAHMVREG